MKQLIGGWTAIVVLTLALFGIANAAAQGTVDDPAQVEAGQAVFEANCVRCHGADGTGTNTGRPLTDIAAQQPDRSVNIANVTDGKGIMPAWGETLTPEEIDAAVSYVRLTFVTEAAPEAPETPEPVSELPTTGVSGIGWLLAGGLVLVAMGALLIQLTKPGGRVA